MRHKFALAKQKKLLKCAQEIAFANGAVPTTDGFYEFQLNTSVGLLRMSFTPGHALASVFCRFEEPARTMEVIKDMRLNPYSGKWNWHWNRNDNQEIVLSDFNYQLSQLTMVVPIVA